MFIRILLLTLIPYIVFAEDLTKGGKDTIFIGEILVQPSVTELAVKQKHDLDLKRVVESLDSQMITSLNAAQVFQLVDRKRFNDILSEQKFASVTVDPNDKNLAKGAKLAGAKFVFLPQIDGFEDKTTSKTVKSDFLELSKTTSRRSIYLSVVVQILDTTTGALLPGSPSVTVDTSMVPADITGDRFYVELAKVAATKLAQNAISQLRPPKVIDVTGDQIMINRGIDTGFVVDTPIDIYAVKEVKDEDTGEIYRSEIPVGKAKVIRGDSKQSFATIVGDNLGIAPGCIARPSKVKVESKAKPNPSSNAKKRNKTKSGASQEEKDSDW